MLAVGKTAFGLYGVADGMTVIALLAFTMDWFVSEMLQRGITYMGLSIGTLFQDSKD